MKGVSKVETRTWRRGKGKTTKIKSLFSLHLKLDGKDCHTFLIRFLISRLVPF